MGPIGVPEMLGIFVIALLLFGPKKLPELGRTLGKAITEFRRASNELKSTFESHLSDLEKEVQLEKKQDYSSLSSSSTAYSYPHDEYGQYTSDYDYTSPSHALPSGSETVEHSSAPVKEVEVRADFYSSESPVYSGTASHPKVAQEKEAEGKSSAAEASHSA